MDFRMKDIFIEHQKTPIGLDEAKPRFSWTLDGDGKNIRQAACRIQVEDMEDKKLMWDSGRLATRESRGIPYDGSPLMACTRYAVRVTVWAEEGNIQAEENSEAGESLQSDENFQTGKNFQTGESYFETGFLNPSIEAWEGAKWIAAPRYTVSADNRGVFIIESVFRLKEGSRRAGIVFGANDYRLMDSMKNEYGLAGENYIRFEINLEGEAPTLDIYRVGYAREDRADVPFASVILADFKDEEKKPLITEENKYAFHTLRIEVDGNNSYTYLDGVLADAAWKDEFGNQTIVGRTLNPRGNNDVITYPRLCEIGFFAGEGDTAYFKGLTVRNMRTPSNIFIEEMPGHSLGRAAGQGSIFDSLIPNEDGCFVVSGRQVSADPSNTSIPMLRRSFEVEDGKEVGQARLYITSRGIYSCSVNGRKVEESLLAPGLTQYDKRLNYQTYDITDSIKAGKNAVGVTLSSGWWSDAQTFVVRNYNYFGDKEALLAKLVICYKDGSREVIVSELENWKYFGDGPYVYAGLFNGEIYDAGKAWIYEDYSKPDFEDENWEQPVEYKPEPIDSLRTMPVGFGRAWPAVNQQEPELTGSYDAPVSVVDKRTAQNCKEAAPGVWIYDLGQEMAGVPRITFHEKAGTRIVLRYAEVLYPDMPEYAGNEGKMMLENYRDAASTDIYICSGKEGGEIYQPRFTFHGYRYIEISGAQNPPKLEEVESLQYSSVTNFEGSFTSSNELLNRFVQNVRWSQLCNFISIPTDCPQRNERMGWAGDTHVFCHTALNNSYLKDFYERNLQAMADLQEESGQFPEIAPVGGGFGGITYECASIFMTYELYQQYGDIRTIEKFYPGLVKYMDYMEAQGLPGKGDISVIGPLGDWLAPQETDLQLLWNAFYYREADLMAKLSAALGKTDMEQKYVQLAQKVKKYWNETFVDKETGKTVTMSGEPCDTQCSYALSIEYGVMEDVRRAGEHLARKASELHYTVGTGFFGTGLLNQALTRLGYEKEAYQLMLQTAFPSWLYPVTQGATTIWEHWDSYTKEKGFGGQNAMNSFNHYSLGSVLSWLYSAVLGIVREEENPGYSHFTLRPVIGELEYARGSVSSPYGTIYSGWKKENGKLLYDCTIPANTQATLILPDGSRKELGSGSYRFGNII